MEENAADSLEEHPVENIEEHFAAEEENGAHDAFYSSVSEALETLTTGPSQYKWLAFPQRFLQQARVCVELAGTKPGEAIYDIGCGAGYLLWFCRERLGCHVEGCEPLKGMPIYKELHDALELDSCITSFESSIALPLPQSESERETEYDVIFATWITWIGYGNWSQGELAEYIHGCLKRLRPGGRLLLRFEESRFKEDDYEQVLSAMGLKVAPLCYLFLQTDSNGDC